MIQVLVIIVPLAGAFLLPLIQLIHGKATKPAIIMLGTASFFLNLIAAYSGWHDPGIHLTGGWPAGIGIALVNDPLSAPFLSLAALGFGATLICSFSKNEEIPWKFYILFFLSWASVNGITGTGDLFNLYVFYEIFSVSAYLLVAFSTMEWQAIEAGFKYLVFGTVGAMFFLMGTAYMFMITGLLNLAGISGSLAMTPGLPLYIPGGCFLIALSIKTGAFPSHFWLPDAHSSARTLVSALLSGVLVMASIYVFIRLFSLFFIAHVPRLFSFMLITGSLSLVTGHIMAFRQEDIKRLLAYSTVAHIGYILIGIGCASAAGASAAIFHSFNHMGAKMGLFITTGILTRHAGTRRIVELSGLGWKFPFSTAFFAFFAAVLIGVPPLNGFMSKWFLTLACIEKGQFLPALLLILGAVISSGYYLRVLKILFSGQRGSDTETEISLPGLAAGLLAALCVLLSVLPLFPGFTENLNILGNWIVDISGYKGLVIMP